MNLAMLPLYLLLLLLLLLQPGFPSGILSSLAAVTGHLPPRSKAALSRPRRLRLAWLIERPDLDRPSLAFNLCQLWTPHDLVGVDLTILLYGR